MIRIYSYDVISSGRCSPAIPLKCSMPATDGTAVAPRPATTSCSPRSPSAARPRNSIASSRRTTALIDYYDENGNSAKKFLVRKPVPEGITSGFGLRRHPLLGYTKMHTGVDWAAPTGTPIYAAGNGVIEKEGWESGYGKFILIRHNNGYETAYGHMSAYAQGHPRRRACAPGPDHRLRRLHRPVDRLASAFRNPDQWPLCRPDAGQAAAGRDLTGPMLAAFEQERAAHRRIMAAQARRA